MAKILIVEDDPNLSGVLQDHLASENHIIEAVMDGQEALDLLQTFPYDVVILDVMLPGLTGFEVCQRYRAHGGKAKILMLTGQQSMNDKEAGFVSGADDYVTKPFHAKEILLRIRALMRRPEEITPDVLSLEDLTLHARTFAVCVNDKHLRLSPKEFALLEFFMRHPNSTFSADAILDRVWRSDSSNTTDTVKTHVHRIREKLKAAASEKTPAIVTVHAAGYMLKTSDR